MTDTQLTLDDAAEAGQPSDAGESPPAAPHSHCSCTPPAPQPCMHERLGQLVAEAFAEMIAYTGAESLTSVWYQKVPATGARIPGLRAKFLTGAANLIMLGVLMDEAEREGPNGDSIVEMLAHIGAAEAAEHSLLRFVNDETFRPAQ